MLVVPALAVVVLEVSGVFVRGADREITAAGACALLMDAERLECILADRAEEVLPSKE